MQFLLNKIIYKQYNNQNLIIKRNQIPFVLLYYIVDMMIMLLYLMVTSSIMKNNLYLLLKIYLTLILQLHFLLLMMVVKIINCLISDEDGIIFIMFRLRFVIIMDLRLISYSYLFNLYDGNNRELGLVWLK